MLKSATTFTELMMLLYWLVAAAMSLKIISIDPALMYSDHENPLVVAWNWSFFPIDIAFSITGLYATFGSAIGARKFKLEIIAATLMACAGLMATSFWALAGDFDPTWWGMNMWLIVLGAMNLTFANFKATSS